MADYASAVCAVAVIAPPGVDYLRLPCGVVEHLAQDILERSGFGAPETVEAMLAEARQAMGAFERQAECVIATAFPQISFEEMQDWPVAKLVDRLARAEWTLRNVHGLPVEFRKQEQNQSKPPDEKELRKAGIDPMRLLDPASLWGRYADLPVIGGTQLWRGAHGALRRTSRQAPGVPGTPPEQGRTCRS